MAEALRMFVEIPGGVSYPDFDKRIMKRELRAAGSPLRAAARKLVSGEGQSKAGQYPGKLTGLLRKSVAIRTSRSGFSLAVYENPKPFKKAYYPAFVYYGHRGPYTETSASARAHRKRVGIKVAAPRLNWIHDASANFARREWPKVARAILEKALKPVFAK